mmetsp:Transcript_24163/g.69457  ORF Transcript_24163/g.69457 Transcript_24163/m.69457 type:complete len:200 (-) Transcript_24163:609-1208(-)
MALTCRLTAEPSMPTAEPRFSCPEAVQQLQGCGDPHPTTTAATLRTAVPCHRTAIRDSMEVHRGAHRTHRGCLVSRLLRSMAMSTPHRPCRAVRTTDRPFHPDRAMRLHRTVACRRPECRRTVNDRDSSRGMDHQHSKTNSSEGTGHRHSQVRDMAMANRSSMAASNRQYQEHIPHKVNTDKPYRRPAIPAARDPLCWI